MPLDPTSVLLMQQAASRQNYADRAGLLASPLAASQIISFGAPVTSNVSLPQQNMSDFSGGVLGLYMAAGQYNTHLSENIYMAPQSQTSKCSSPVANTPPGQCSSQSSSTTGTDPEVAISSDKAQELKNTYGPKHPNLSNLFFNKVVDMAARLGIEPEHLMRAMNRESGLDPTAVNSIGAGGLIGFLKSTAKILGTTVDDLRKMTAAEQLDYVEKFYKMVGVRPGDSANVIHARAFLPGRIGSNPTNDTVLCRAGETDKNGKLLQYYEQNAPLDANKDGVITIAEL